MVGATDNTRYGDLFVIVRFGTAGQAIMGLPIGNRFRLRSFLVGNPSFRKEQDTPVIRVQC